MQERGTRSGSPFRQEDEPAAPIVGTVIDAADALQHHPGQVAIAQVRQQPRPTIPSLGARTPDQLRDDLAALDLVRDADVLARLDAFSDIPLGSPHDTLRRPRQLDAVAGGNAAVLDFDRTSADPQCRHSRRRPPRRRGGRVRLGARAP